MILAFKYLRLFRHLELLAHRIALLVQISDSDLFKHEIGKIKEDIWDGSTNQIKLFQFREHFIRHQLQLARKKLPTYSSDDEIRLASLIGDYDEMTEFPVVLELVDRLSEVLSPEILADLANNMRTQKDAVVLVDKATGWSV